LTLDITLEAIEADLAQAERGGPYSAVHIARAQVRATLLAAGRQPAPTPVWVNDTGQDILIAEGEVSTVYTVPTNASRQDRMEAAAHLLGVPADLFVQLMTTDHSPKRHLVAGPPLDLDPSAIPLDVPGKVEDDEDGIDEDFFAEAKAERRRKR
jgi:hypothetical protein